MVPSVEIDRRILAKLLVAERGQSEKTSKRRDGTGGQSRQGEHFVTVCESEFTPAVQPANLFAVQFAIGWYHKHDELVFPFADERLGPSG